MTAAITTPNPFQPTASTVSQIASPGTTNRGLCTISYGENVFRFRTNPNEIWWDYELITHVDQTYGGRVVQILGTRLGDLTVKVECGAGGWTYLQQVVTYLRNMLSDQRDGVPATFEYTTRNWKLNVFAMNVPIEDEVTATTRELTLNFKIQEDVNGVVTSTTMQAELSNLQDGIYRPGTAVHNQYNDPNVGPGGAPVPPVGTAESGAGSPSNYPGTGITNTVDSTPQGQNPGGLNPIAGQISGISSIPGLGILGGLL